MRRLHRSDQRLAAPDPIPETGSSSEAAGYETTRQFLRSHEPPDAIFTTGDYLAIGAMRACREAGLRVPQDVGVIGATGLDVARHVQPTLATASQPMEEIGRAAGQMLMHMARHGICRVPGRIIPSTFSFRESLPLAPDIQREIQMDIAPAEQINSR